MGGELNSATSQGKVLGTYWYKVNSPSRFPYPLVFLSSCSGYEAFFWFGSRYSSASNFTGIVRILQAETYFTVRTMVSKLQDEACDSPN